VVRYEDLTDNLLGEMKHVSKFLDIEPHPILLTPTAGAMPLQSNSSFRKTAPGVVEARRGPEVPTRDAGLISALAGSPARPWGYAVPRVGVWQGCVLRLQNILSDLSKLPRRIGGAAQTHRGLGGER
jgi:hypothetical protein